MRGRIAAAAGAALVLAAPAVALSRDFNAPGSQDPQQQFSYGQPLGPGNPQRQDTPNDPHYDNAEPDTLSGRSSTNLFDERFDLFGFPSQLTPAAVYRDGPHAGKPQISGFNAAGAWKLDRGRADVVVAILDTGILWQNVGLRLAVHLNTGELPLPQHADGSTCASYDCNGDGAVNVDDYAHDPRVALSYPGRTGLPGLITGQDLIHAFGDCKLRAQRIVRCRTGRHFDNDHNGYANDIAGWNFFDNTNDPTDRSSYFSAAGHGSGRAQDAAEQGNDGQGSIGVCPHCQVMPIRVWDTFVSDGDTFALGMTYATDNHARVIEGADGSLYHSAFAERASQYAYDRGVVQTYSGDDLNTANHNYPANYSHTMLIQGTIPDTLGEVPTGVNVSPVTTLPLPIGTQLPPQTYFRGANVTQWGGHSSLSMEGVSGSENTGKASGAAALVISAALDHGIALAPDETREILEQTAERVTAGDEQGLGSGDLAAPANVPADLQWTSHFGWGRANVGAAVALASSGQIPPVAAISSPDWFAPLTGASVRIKGRAQAPRAPGGAFHYRLMWAPGLQPDPSSWRVAAEGNTGGRLMSLGTIDLNAVRQALASTQPQPDPGAPTFSPYAPNPLASQFNVQLEVSAPGTPTVGIDRRVFTALADPTLRRGFPKRLGTGGEAPVRYAALTSSNRQELIVPTEDGRVHAYLPGGRRELRGWPARTRKLRNAVGHGHARALRRLGIPLEPPRAPVIADLHGDGQPDLITAAGVHIYAWNARGRLLRGFPLSEDLSLCGPAHESQPLHHPKCGFLASPAVGHLQGAHKPLDIVAASLDGHLYAWNASGHRLPGYPVALVDPHMPPSKQDIAETITDPAIGDLNGSGHDDVVIGTNEEYPASNSSPSISGGLAGLQGTLLSVASGGSARVYAIDGASGRIMSGWPVAINGALQQALPLVGPGNDAEIARIGGRETVIASATGGALSEYAADGALLRTIQQTNFGSGSDATDRTDVANLFESAAVGQLTGKLSVVKYGMSLGQVINLALSGQNVPYNHLIGAYDTGSGQPLPAWPTITDDYQFLSSSTIARVAVGAQDNQVIAGTGLGLLHAYDGFSGRDVAGFPKVTGGWLFSPAAISIDGRIADITREGYLFEWGAPVPRCQSEWPTFRHDLRDSGNYNADVGPPAAPTHVRLRRLSGNRYRLSFVSPGAHGMCGTARAYVLRRGRRVVRARTRAPRPAGARVRVKVTLAGSVRGLLLQARNEFGDLGIPAALR